MTKQVGFQSHPVTKKTVLVLNKKTLEIDGGEIKTVTDFVYEGENFECFDSSLDLVTCLSDAEGEALSTRLFNFNSPEIAYGLVGWTTSTFFKHRLEKIYSPRFPILFLKGTAGSGKTMTVQIPQAIYGLPSGTKLQNFFDDGRWARTLMLASSRTFPVILDELKPKNDAQRNQALALFNAVYNSHAVVKGRADLSSVSFKKDAPLMVLAESWVGDNSTLERVVILPFSKTDSRLGNRSEVFDELLKQPLTKLGNTMAILASTMTDDEIQARFDALEDELKPEIPDDRPRFNAAVVLFGVWLVLELLNQEKMLAAAKKAVVSLFVGDSEDSELALAENPIDKVLNAMEYMSLTSTKTVGDREYEEHVSDRGRLREGIHYKRLTAAGEEGCIAYVLPLCWPEIELYFRAREGMHFQSSGDFLVQIRKYPERYVDYKNMRLGGKVVKCLVVRSPGANQTEVSHTLNV
jgi:hypothetical protein